LIGGYYNTASRSYATVAGSSSNKAMGNHSFADASPGSVFNSIRDNEFAVRCSGVVRFYTNWNPGGRD